MKNRIAAVLISDNAPAPLSVGDDLQRGSEERGAMC